jgi:regulator of replication initiation timing
MNTAELEKIHSEISKLMAETGKLNAETGKLNAENRKLNAENRKLTREVFWYPLAVSTGLVSAVAGITAILIKLL